MSEQTIPGSGYAPGVFRISDVFSRAFSVLGRRFPLFFLIYLVSALPGRLIVVLFGVSGQPVQPDPRALLATIGGSLLAMLLAILGQSTVLFVAYQTLRNQPVTLGEAFGRALNRFFPMLGVILCFSLAVMFGLLLLVVPGAILAVRYYTFAAVCLIEQRGPIDSLGRSAELTQGHRWPIFGLALLVAVATGIITLPITLLLPTLLGQVTAGIIAIPVTAATGAVNSTIFVAVYQALRLAKEGGDGDHLARVFD